MQLLPELAEKIMSEVRLIMKEDLIVVDENGIIIAATKEERMGDFHKIAERVVHRKRKYYISEEEAIKIHGVKAGINLPIFFENAVIGVIGITGPPDEVEGYADLLRKMTELMIRETYYNEQREWENKGLESYFYEWVYSKEVDEDFIQRGQLLGVRVGHPYICILLRMKEEDSNKPIQSSLDWFRKFFPREKNDVFIHWGDGSFLLLKSFTRDRTKQSIKEQLITWKRYLQTNYRVRVGIGVSKSVVSLDMKQAYLEAEKAVKVSFNKHSVVMYDDLVLDIILEEVSHQTRREFEERVLSNLQGKVELLGTLQAFLDHNLSVKETSLHMNIHINTLHYRLRQIEELTGINPRATEGITLFYIVLRFLYVPQDKNNLSE